MSSEGDPAVGACIQAFLNALAADDGGLLQRFALHRKETLDEWFDDNTSCGDEKTREAAKTVILNGDFSGATLHLGAIPPPDRDSDAWLTVNPTIWLV